MNWTTDRRWNARLRLLQLSGFLVLFFISLAIAASGDPRGRGKGGGKQATQNSPSIDAPSHPYDVVLCRPERNSVTLSILAYQDIEGCIVYGAQRGNYTLQTAVRRFKKDEPAEIVLNSLQPNTCYFYEFRSRGLRSTEGSFQTQRFRGSAFTFTVTADSHLDDHTSGSTYRNTLANALADAPDFHIDLGDTFMTEKHENRENAARQYLAQRFYFGELCRSAPLFLVLGNHDGESPRGPGSDADSLAIWSNAMRKRFFPNPISDAFFSANTTKHPQGGLLQDYYAWEWGDALFVVLDPFWFTQRQRGKGDNWKHSLGAEQYQWFKSALETSQARFKFVFIHHLVGGVNDQCRGGAEAAPFYEWGGKNADGSDGFKQNRPMWPAPIHRLLVQNHVSIVFHGHDHLYAKEDLDGIVYQEVPQPADPKGNTRSAEDYGYKSGVILGSSGHLRVNVTSSRATVEYRCVNGGDCKTAHSYSVAHVSEQADANSRRPYLSSLPAGSSSDSPP